MLGLGNPPSSPSLLENNLVEKLKTINLETLIANVFYNIDSQGILLSSLIIDELKWVSSCYFFFDSFVLFSTSSSVLDSLTSFHVHLRYSLSSATFTICFLTFFVFKLVVGTGGACGGCWSGQPRELFQPQGMNLLINAERLLEI